MLNNHLHRKINRQISVSVNVPILAWGTAETWMKQIRNISRVYYFEHDAIIQLEIILICKKKNKGKCGNVYFTNETRQRSI